MSKSYCHYNYHKATKSNSMDDALELASPSCLQFHPENVSMPKHSSLAKVIITNTPVNNIATQLQKNAWKHTGGESATEGGRCGGSPAVGLLMASSTVTGNMAKQGNYHVHRSLPEIRVMNQTHPIQNSHFNLLIQTFVLWSGCTIVGKHGRRAQKSSATELRCVLPIDSSQLHYRPILTSAVIHQ
jgi:hypothetical protein